jgi:hypothetical protein
LPEVVCPNRYPTENLESLKAWFARNYERRFISLSLRGIEDSNTFTNESQLNLLSTDPVISEFQKYGTVVKAPASYTGNISNECTSYDAIYFFTADNGPYAGKQSEIYRFLHEEDITEGCDDSFNLSKVIISEGGWSWYACPEKGNSCKNGTDIDGGCLLIFCDEID